MKNCTNYWRTRAKLAEAVIAENQIGAWKKWDEIRNTEPPTIDKQRFIDYIHEYAFEFGKLWNTELSHDKKVDRIGEKMKTPEEFINDNL